MGSPGELNLQVEVREGWVSTEQRALPSPRVSCPQREQRPPWSLPLPPSHPPTVAHSAAGPAKVWEIEFPVVSSHSKQKRGFGVDGSESRVSPFAMPPQFTRPLFSVTSAGWNWRDWR